MRKLLASVLTLILLAPLAAFAGEGRPLPDFGVDVDAQCPEYGCAARLIPLASGGWTLLGWARYPTTWYPKTPPATTAKVFVEGDLLQTIPIRWQVYDYVCCCPAEWYGEFADELAYHPAIGEVLEIVIGEPALCWSEVVVPEIDEHGLRDFAPPTPDLPEPPTEFRGPAPVVLAR